MESYIELLKTEHPNVTSLESFGQEQLRSRVRQDLIERISCFYFDCTSLAHLFGFPYTGLKECKRLLTVNLDLLELMCQKGEDDSHLFFRNPSLLEVLTRGSGNIRIEVQDPKDLLKIEAALGACIVTGASKQRPK